MLVVKKWNWLLAITSLFVSFLGAAHAEKKPKTILTVNRLEREDSLLFKLLYEMHLLVMPWQVEL